MGLNPFRGAGNQKSVLDYAMVVGAFALAIAAIIWAILG